MDTVNSKIIFMFGLMLVSGSVFAHAIGTLFYSPSERAALVAARSGIAQTAIYTVTGITYREAGQKHRVDQRSRRQPDPAGSGHPDTGHCARPCADRR
jgi:hypothetical protein